MEKMSAQEVMALLEDLRDANIPFIKRKRSFQDLLLGEIAYALIFSYTRPNFVKDCYRLAGLKHDPNMIFLVQVDDFYEHYYSLPASRGYYLKSNIIQCLNDRLQQLGLEGFVTNMVATTHLICFLHIPVEDEDSVDTIDNLFHIAEELKNYVHDQTHYAATVAISGFCHSFHDFPTAYHEAMETLYRSFSLGRESIIFSKDCHDTQPQYVKPLDNVLAPLFQSVRNINKSHYMTLVTAVVEHYLEANATPQQIRINFIMLVHELELYAARLGIDQEVLTRTSREISSRISRCNFVVDIYQIMEDYFIFFAAQIQQLTASQDSKFRQLVNGYLTIHYAEPIDLRTLAQLCNYSAIHFGRLFKKIYGQNFSQYLTRYRLEKAIQLLCETEQPIETIASKVGFNSVSYFCTTFKNYMGISPKKYRMQNQIGQQHLPNLVQVNSNLKNKVV